MAAGVSFKRYPMDHLPTYSQDLVEHLMETYGSYEPDPSEHPNEMWLQLGMKKLATRLHEIHKRDQENIMETP